MTINEAKEILTEAVRAMPIETEKDLEKHLAACRAMALVSDLISQIEQMNSVINRHAKL